ncbi:myosin-1 isoform X12 [Drosophila yakuba]|uniref:myosin-1 isoform X12 n=1 Tax=Drosophila yakuba TaxID=7245 RepID=UPI00193082B3|nr:myosin-1 isoform X12 [Drosophila yakuba]
MLERILLLKKAIYQFVYTMSIGRKVGYADMTAMSEIDEIGINQNLNVRYNSDIIYTYTGSILLAVNPYKSINIYNTDAIEQMEPAEAQRNTRLEIEELFFRPKVCVQEHLGPDATSTGIHESKANFGHTSAVKLPRFSLPTFDGKYCEYQNLVLSFNEVVGHQQSMSKIKKFNQL